MTVKTNDFIYNAKQTNVPRSFVVKDLMVNGKEVWVGGNATKHMGEFINSANKAGGGLLSENEIMESFMDAAKLASEQTLNMAIIGY